MTCKRKMRVNFKYFSITINLTYEIYSKLLPTTGHVHWYRE